MSSFLYSTLSSSVLLDNNTFCHSLSVRNRWQSRFSTISVLWDVNLILHTCTRLPSVNPFFPSIFILLPEPLPSPKGFTSFFFLVHLAFFLYFPPHICYRPASQHLFSLYGRCALCWPSSLLPNKLSQLSDKLILQGRCHIHINSVYYWAKKCTMT